MDITFLHPYHKVKEDWDLSHSKIRFYIQIHDFNTKQASLYHDTPPNKQHTNPHYLYVPSYTLSKYNSDLLVSSLEVRLHDLQTK